MIQELIAQCAWSPSTLLVFSSNVFNPLIYYSHFVPLILALVLGGFVFFKNRAQEKNRVFFLVTILFAIWVFCDLVVWATDNINQTMFFWAIINLVEPLIYAASLYFFYTFFDRKDLFKKYSVVIFFLLLPTLLLTPTRLAIQGFDLTNCDREVVEGPLVYYGYFIEAVFSLWLLIGGISFFRKQIYREKKRQIILILLGLLLFLSTFAFGNLIGSLSVDWSVGQYGLFGMPILIGFLSYLIVKYDAFNTKLFTAQMTSFVTVLLVASLLLLQNTRLIHIIIIPTIIILIVTGVILVRSIKREIEQKEKLEQLRLRLEESNLDLANANDKLKGLDKLKTEFLSLAAHQLRSPLTAIKGYSSMLDEGSYGKLEPGQDEAVRRIYASAQGLVNIVEDLLNVSKIEQGGMQYIFLPIELGAVMTAVYNEMQIPAQNKGLDLKINISKTDKYMVVADGTKIRQVILNLIDNSIKYTPKGFVEISLVKKENKVIFSVRDSGVGISPETKEKLFQKFSRGEGGKLNTGGSGLGLYLAREIAKAHQGDVVIDSEGLGKGSTFSLVLPLAGSQTKEFNVPS